MAAFVSGMFSPVTLSSNVSGEIAVAPRARSSSGPTMLVQSTTTASRGFMNLAKKTASGTLDAADSYMVSSVTKQYKAMSMEGGVYSVQCAEGATKGAAEAKRIAALAAQFRVRQQSTFQKAHNLFENRKRAIIAVSHDCDYEEKMMVNNPKLAAAFALGKAEANRTCVRYATPTSIEEEYMAASVDRQMREKSCSSGVYPTSCQEGSYKGAAEEARVNGLSTAFRTTQKSDSQATNERYAMAKYGRDQFAHGCSHEESQFAEYPAAAAAMRSDSYGY